MTAPETALGVVASNTVALLRRDGEAARDAVCEAQLQRHLRVGYPTP